MTATIRPFFIVSFILMFGALTACEQGNEQRSDAERDQLRQELQQAKESTEQALRRNALLQSRLTILENEAAAAADAVEPVATTEVTLAPEPLAAVVADAETGDAAGAAEVNTDAEVVELRAQVAELTAERDILHELLEENEEALRDGVANAARQQHDTQRLEAELSSVQAAAEAGRAEFAAVKAKLAEMQALAASEPPKPDESTAAQAGLKEQLQALQADKMELEKRLSEQDAKLAALLEEHRQALQAANEEIANLKVAAGAGHEEVQATVSREASLKEQLVAVQADKAALESRVAEQDAAMSILRGDKSKADSRVATVEEALASARAHGNSLAEQLAAIQADTRGLEARLISQSQQLHEAQTRSRVVEIASAETQEGKDGASGDGSEQTGKLLEELVSCRAEEARLRDRAKSVEEELALVVADEGELQRQLKGAVAQAKALQQEVLALKDERGDRDREFMAMEADCEQYRTRAAPVLKAGVDAADDNGGDGGSAPEAGHGTLSLAQAAELQALLEESQALLEACNASLGAGARDMFELEQRTLGLKNALQRQRRVSAARCRTLAGRLKGVMAENRRLSGMLPPPLPPVAPPPRPPR